MTERIESLIRAIAPTWALKREIARRELAALSKPEAEPPPVKRDRFVRIDNHEWRGVGTERELIDRLRSGSRRTNWL